MNSQQKAKSSPSLVIKRVIKANRERVFEAWADPRQLEKWFHPEGWSARTSNTFQVGGKYLHEMISNGLGKGCSDDSEIGRTKDEVFPHSGEYLEIVRPERLVFTWNSPFAKDTRVTVEFRDLGGETELTLTHEFFASDESREQHNQGWTTCLGSLENYLGD